ncbi:MAG: 50S ribosomal protein L5 [Patescibacteria group bacterium]|nr:50S ribosomal protein L5 [Patescibacteria group bacterium]
MQSDYLEKIIVSVGVGKQRLTSPQFEEKVLPEIMKEVAAITGQKPAVTKAKKSIAGFKALPI